MPNPIKYEFGYKVNFCHNRKVFRRKFPTDKFQDPEQAAKNYINNKRGIIPEDALRPQQGGGVVMAIYPQMIQGWTVEKIMRYWEKITAGHCYISYRHRHKPALFMGRSPLSRPYYFGFKNYRVGGLVN